MKEPFPEVEIKWMFLFRLSQNMRKKRVASIGESSAYNNDVSFALKAMILRLAFISLRHIHTYIDPPLCELTRRTGWIGSKITILEDQIDGKPLEDLLSFPRKFGENVAQGTELGTGHATRRRFITRMQKNHDAFFGKLIGGRPSRPELKQYMKADERSLEIVSSFTRQSSTEYLRGFSYNAQ